jgi:hypothetical protein
MAGFRIEGNTSGNVAEVDATNHLKVVGTTDPKVMGGSLIFSQNDAGVVTGTQYALSPETDDDYRLRVAHEQLMDTETFNYTAQNTGKHLYYTTTMTNAWTANGMQTNSASGTAINTGTRFSTWAFFPLYGAAHLYIEYEASFSAAAFPTNTTIDLGIGLGSVSTPYAPTDGTYFRATSAGLFGVINYNGTETVVGPFVATFGGASWAPIVNKKYQFLISITERDVEFWIDGNLMGDIPVPTTQGQPFQSAALPIYVRHAIGGTAAGAAFQLLISDYTVTCGGPAIIETLGVTGNRAWGSYQGLSGGTMGSLATYVNSTNPTAAAPSNTALTANLPGGLGGQGQVTAAAAAATDGIWSSYQVPAGTVAVQGKRLKVTGILVDAVNLGAAVATTATVVQFSLAFGHTAASLATTETGTSQTKAPRRIALGFMSWAIGAAIGDGSAKGPIYLPLLNPVYVNPGEFIALVGKFVAGTATASQTIQFTLTYDYGWE